MYMYALSLPPSLLLSYSLFLGSILCGLLCIAYLCIISFVCTCVVSIDQ